MDVGKIEPVFVPANQIVITHEPAPSLHDLRDELRALREDVLELKALLEQTDEVKRAQASVFNE